MIDDDINLLHHPIQLYAILENRRSWRWLWLRRRAKKKLFFAGYTSNLSWSRSMNDVDRLSIDLESAEARFKLRPALYTTGPAAEEEAV